MPFYEFICLANSRKHGGRCVAGIRTDGGGWIRPVTERDNGALLPQHYTLRDGTQVHALDLLRIEVVKPHTRLHQPENWLVGAQTWELVARPAPRTSLALLRNYILAAPTLLGNTYDRIHLKKFGYAPVGASLALVIPQAVTWQVKETGPGQHQLRALFTLNDTEYNLAVTDLEWGQRFFTCQPGYTQTDQRIVLIISLGEPFNNYCYKLVAGVLPFAQFPKD